MQAADAAASPPVVPVPAAEVAAFGAALRLLTHLERGERIDAAGDEVRQRTMARPRAITRNLALIDDLAAGAVDHGKTLGQSEMRGQWPILAGRMSGAVGP